MQISIKWISCIIFIRTHNLVLIYNILLTRIYECLIFNIDCSATPFRWWDFVSADIELFIVIFDGDPLNNYQLRPVTESFPRTAWRSPDARNPSQGRTLLNLDSHWASTSVAWKQQRFSTLMNMNVVFSDGMQDYFYTNFHFFLSFN